MKYPSEIRGQWATLLTWLTLAHIEIFFQYQICISFPFAPSDLRGQLFQPTSLNCSMSECFHVKFSFSGFIVLKNKIFKWLHPFLTFLYLSPLWRAPGPSFEQTRNSLHPRINCTKFDWIGLLVLEKKIFKNFQCIFTLSLLSPLVEG
jgi:hypothetical protein